MGTFRISAVNLEYPFFASNFEGGVIDLLLNGGLAEWRHKLAVRGTKWRSDVAVQIARHTLPGPVLGCGKRRQRRYATMHAVAAACRPMILEGTCVLSNAARLPVNQLQKPTGGTNR